MLRRTKAVGQADNSISCRDLEVSGVLRGPAFSNITTAIETLVANGQRIGGWVVAASTYKGKTNYTCDGTADQVQIQAAIAACYAQGGGTVFLTEGTFNTTAAISLSSKVTLEGEGAASIIKKNCNDYAIKAVGTSGAHLSSVSIRDMTITRDAADTNDKVLLYAVYVDNLQILHCSFLNSYVTSIVANYITGALVSTNTIQDAGRNGLSLSYFSGIVSNNIIYNAVNHDTQSVGIVTEYATGVIIRDNIIGPLRSGDFCSGIYASAGNDVLIVDNHIDDLLSWLNSGDHYVCAGIYVVNGTQIRITGNRISNCSSTRPAGTGAAYGIDILAVTTAAQIANNVCIDNGNMVIRSGCESATDPCITGQAGNNEEVCTFERSADFAHNGTYGYKFTKGNAAGTEAKVNFHDHHAGTTTDMAGLVAGCSYSFSVWVYIPAASGILGSEVFVELYDYLGGWAGTVQAAANIYDAWQLVTVPRTLRAAATGALVRVRAASAAALNEYFYVDDIRLRPDGVHNEHGQNFSDAGTGTRQSGDSWLAPFQV